IRGPFRVNNTSTAKTPYGIRDITDGTSSTMLMSEVSLAPNIGTVSDARGDVWGESKCAFVFTAATPPNSKVPDQLDGKGGCPSTTGPPPCFAATGSQAEFNAARSYHSGGVNAAFCDGSVKFIKDSVAISPY